jgi:ribosome-binding protein aMBF1 (putative translation factor)
MKHVIEKSNDVVKLIKQRREVLGISQKELAQLCDLSHNGISKMESSESEVKLSTLLRMSKFLGIKLVIEMEE